MRTVTKIYFITEGEEKYDPSTGDYKVLEGSRDLVMGNVSDTGEERMVLLHGSVKQDAKTIRLNVDYNKPFDYIEVDGKLYKDTLNKKLNRRRVFEVVGI